MSELMMKMAFWLLIAALLGFLIGWFYSKAKQREKSGVEIDELNSIVHERNQMLEKLEKKFRNQKIMIDKLILDYEKSEEVLAQKTGELRQMKLNIDNNDTKTLREENLKLVNEIESLKKREQKKVKELADLEKVLMKAEEIIEESSDKIENLKENIESLLLENEEQQNIAELYRETIADFEEELKLYTANRDEGEFIISKDQFTHIEEQLIEYQKEIESLKKMNRELLANNSIESKKKMREEESEIEDGSVTKIFKETYNKITKN